MSCCHVGTRGAWPRWVSRIPRASLLSRVPEKRSTPTLRLHQVPELSGPGVTDARVPGLGWRYGRGCRAGGDGFIKSQCCFIYQRSRPGAGPASRAGRAWLSLPLRGGGGSVPSPGPGGAPAWWASSLGERWVPAPLAQEGTFSFGVPRKNCRTRSARSARQKSRSSTWAMTSLNCQACGRQVSMEQWLEGQLSPRAPPRPAPPQGCPRGRTGC